MAIVSQEAYRYEEHLINTAWRLERALENTDAESEATCSDGGISYQKLCRLLDVQKYNDFERETLSLISSLAPSCVAAGACVVDVDLLGRKLRSRSVQWPLLLAPAPLPSTLPLLFHQTRSFVL